MNTTSAVPPVQKQPTLLKDIVARLAQIVVGFGMVAAILFLAAGRIDWLWAWVFLGISVISVLINASLMLRRSPETIAERGRYTGMQDWDKLISGFWAVAQYLALPLTAGLDVRFGWTAALGREWHVAGTLVFAGSLALSSWAMISNAYFSSVVRIQRDRGQTVCRSGPYRFVRHPGYSGFIVQSLALPLLLGSWWVFIPGGVAAALIIIRTVFEDRLLHAELNGYREYAADVRYRLIPWIW